MSVAPDECVSGGEERCDLEVDDTPWKVLHDSCISAIAISPDCKYIISGSWGSSVILWDSSSGDQIARFQDHSQEISAVCFSTDGKFIISGSYDGIVCARTQSTDKSWNRIAMMNSHSDVVSSIVAMPFKGQTRIISGSWDTTLRIYHANGDEVATLEGHGDIVSSIAASNDGSYVVSGSWDRTVRVWDGVSYSLLTCLSMDGAMEVTGVAFCLDGTGILSGHSDDVIRRWEWPYTTLDQVSFQAAATGQRITSITSGQITGSSSANTYPLIVPQVTAETSKNEASRYYSANDSSWHQNGKLGSLEHLVFLNDNLNALSIGGDDASLQIWDLSIGTSCVTKLRDETPDTATPTSFSISSDNRFIVFGCRSGAMVKRRMGDIMNLDTREEQQVSTVSPKSPSFPILKESKDRLRALNRKADNVKYCAQQIFRVVYDFELLIVQMGNELDSLHNLPDFNERIDRLLDLSNDGIELGRYLTKLNTILDTASSYTGLSNFGNTILDLNSLIHWIHRRPYYEDLQPDWERRYNDTIKYDADKLIERLVNLTLSYRNDDSMFSAVIESIQEQPNSSLVDPYELLKRLLHTFQWSSEPANFSRAVLLEAASCVNCLFNGAFSRLPYTKGSSELDISSIIRDIASILSMVQIGLQNATDIPSNTYRAFVVDTHSRWTSIAVLFDVSDFISGVDTFDIFDIFDIFEGSKDRRHTVESQGPPISDRIDLITNHPPGQRIDEGKSAKFPSRTWASIMASSLPRTLGKVQKGQKSPMHSSEAEFTKTSRIDQHNQEAFFPEASKGCQRHRPERISDPEIEDPTKPQFETVEASSSGPSSTDGPHLSLASFETVCLVDDSLSMGGPLWSQAGSSLAGFVDFIGTYHGRGVNTYFLSSNKKWCWNNGSQVLALFRQVSPSEEVTLWARLQIFLLEQISDGLSTPKYLILLIERPIDDESANEILNGCFEFKTRGHVGIQITQIGNNINTTESLTKLNSKISAAGFATFTEIVPFSEERGPLTAEILSQSLKIKSAAM